MAVTGPKGQWQEAKERAGTDGVVWRCVDNSCPLRHDTATLRSSVTRDSLNHAKEAKDFLFVDTKRRLAMQPKTNVFTTQRFG